MQRFVPSFSRTISSAVNGLMPPQSKRRRLWAGAMFTVMVVLLVGAPDGIIGQGTSSGQAAQLSDLEEVKRLNQQVVQLHREGKYTEALPLAERAMAISEKALGSEHPAFAESLHNFANLHRAKGDYAKAEPLLQRAMAIREKALGSEHAAFGESLNTLAELYREKGDYVRAESLHKRALAIREKALGSEHPGVAQSLNNLALLYSLKGDYVRAEPLFKRALAIREKVFGAEHHSVATTLNTLAGVYVDKGDYVRAEPLYQRAIAIREKVFGAVHPSLATSLSNLATLYSEKGDHIKAEQLEQRALAIREKVFGAEHPFVAVSLYNLAGLYVAKGDYVRAESLYKRDLAISEKLQGAQHPEVAKTLRKLAALYELKGDLTQAVQFLNRATNVGEHNLALILTTGSEEQKRLYLDTLSDETDATVSLHVRSAPRDPQAARLALITILRRKGRVLDAMSDQIGALRRRLNPEDRFLLEQLSAARSQLATLILKGRGQTAHAQHQAELAKLETEVERHEEAVSARSAEFRAQSQPVTLEAVQQTLPEGTALVEWVSYRPVNAKALKKEERFGAARYVAYILRNEGAPSVVELGDAASIDADIARLRGALMNRQSPDVKEGARALDERVMRPVRALAGDATQLLVSPDGELNLIPFEALVDEQGRYLVERYSFAYLTSGRDLLRLQTRRESKSPPVVVADPAFGEPAVVASRADAGRSDDAGGGARLDYSQVFFGPLPGVGDEVRALKNLLPQATFLTKEQATEATVKRVSGPSILHIATHGFFLPNDPPMGNRASAQSKDGTRLGKWVAYAENPMLRSGLALAGANQGRSGDDDGVLTALEATTLDLWGTKLVVLSACDTGVGEVKNGDGVYGLRRALFLAGTESQLMSLWPVSDRSTRELMAEYYKGLVQNAGRGEALRRVQLKMLRNKSRSHPYYWASFILAGEWANLQGRR